MSGVELKPCGVSGGANILVPLGATTIGRGPFLGIADKRVSRNHAILEIEDGVFKVKPIHVNPTFFSKNGEGKLKPLKKGEWKNLENGDKISLTPNEHIFQVVVDDRPILSVTQSPRSFIDSSSPVKSSYKKLEVPKEAPPEEESEDAPSPACRKLDFHAENNDSTAEEETNDNHSDDKHETDQKDELRRKEENNSDNNDEPNPKSTESNTHKEYAKPVDRKRELPAWMSNLSSGSKEESSAPTPKAKNTKGAAKTSSRAKKRVAAKIDEEEEEEEEVKPPSKKRGAPARTQRKAAPTSYKDEEEEEEDYEAPSPKLKRRTSSRGRQTTKVNYVDDLEIYDDEDDEEYVATKDDEESDWEEEASPKKKGKSKVKSPRGAKGRRRRRQKSYSDEESSDEDVYIPKPTKRTAKILSNSQRSADDDDGGRKPSSRRKQESDDEDDEEQVKDNKKREPCVYGAKCYRKNPLHFKEFSHPKDDDYESESEKMDAEKDEDDKPECPYGTDCYRTNLEHKKKFKHVPSSGRPKRQAVRGRKKANDESDEDGPNTYDYEDSFLDDEVDQEETPKGKSSDDSDWGPEPGDDSEDLSQLVKEAKGFVRNKKLQQK